MLRSVIRPRDQRRPVRGLADASRPFHRRVYALVRLVPRGQVVTYGQVAALLGQPRAARAVGQALRALPETAAPAVPWHRVVNAAGRISHRDDAWPELQRELLELEGVHFRKGTLDLARLRWSGRPGPGRRRPVVGRRLRGRRARASR
jgi:methylated-DNA-protein-cysteine methyltransferase-like protein